MPYIYNYESTSNSPLIVKRWRHRKVMVEIDKYKILYQKAGISGNARILAMLFQHHMIFFVRKCRLLGRISFNCRNIFNLKKSEAEGYQLCKMVRTKNVSKSRKWNWKHYPRKILRRTYFRSIWARSFQSLKIVGNWFPYELKPKNVARRFGIYEMLLSYINEMRYLS